MKGACKEEEYLEIMRGEGCSLGLGLQRPSLFNPFHQFSEASGHVPPSYEE